MWCKRRWMRINKQHTPMWLLLLLTAAAVAGALSVLPFPEADVDYHVVREYVSRIRRSAEDVGSSEIHGHSLAVLHAEDPESGEIRRLTKRDVANHATHPSSAERRFSLQLQEGDHVHMALRRRNVVTSATAVVERLAGGNEVNHVATRDCFFTGKTESSELGHASFALCDGSVMGSLKTDKRHYEVVPLPPAARRRRSADDDTLHVLVTWTDLHEERHKRSTDDDSSDDFGDDSLDPPGVDDVNDARAIDLGVWKREVARNPRATLMRDPAEKVAVVEVGVYMDAFYVNTTRNTYGYDDTQWFINLVVLKWSGIWSVLSDPKLGWNITINIARLEIWRENPESYGNDWGESLGARMGAICRRTANIPFDQVTVLTKAADGRVGQSWISTICWKSYKCNAIQPTGLKFNTELHELGHNLGLAHEKGECTKDQYRGFMGGRNDYASACYADVFDNNWPSKTCLFNELWNTNTSISLFTMGQILTPDGQCKTEGGPEFKHVSGYCDQVTCVATDPSNTNFGTVLRNKAVPGYPCAPGKICRIGCQDVNETSWSEVYRRNNIVDGGWGEWSPFGECKVTQEGAAALKKSTRACDNPKPHYGAPCEGTETVRAELCSEVPSSPHHFDMDQLATDICTFHRDERNHSDYTGRGWLDENDGEFGMCLVTCDLAGKRKNADEQYLIPDGVSCTDNSNTAGFNDLSLGHSRYCVSGRCMEFGCDGRILTAGGNQDIDVCGVCGGSGDTCVNG